MLLHWLCDNTRHAQFFKYVLNTLLTSLLVKCSLSMAHNRLSEYEKITDGWYERSSTVITSDCCAVYHRTQCNQEETPSNRQSKGRLRSRSKQEDHQ